MGDAAQAPSEIISLPRGGGAVRGIGETFTADAQTGTGNHTIPLVVPDGRRGIAPSLQLAYSTGSGNGHLGLGWTLSVPGISRKTSRGAPSYDDDRDVFVLSGAEDLIVVGPVADGIRYRPRTESGFATIVHHSGDGQDHWTVTGTDGLMSRYGSVRPPDAAGWHDPATIIDPDAAHHVFAWKLTETRDPLGNVIVYTYAVDEGEGGGHRWRQPLLRSIHYADHGDGQYLASVTLAHEPRDDAFSSYTAGFEIRTARRYASIATHVHPGTDVPVRRYELRYEQDPLNGVSLLSEVEVVGFDDAGAEHRDLPPLALAYTRVEPGRQTFRPVGGPDTPVAALSDGGVELVDVTGDGIPDVLQCNGSVRYWRNRGDGTFDRPREMRDAPAGVRLGERGVRLLDADGDGRADLVVDGGYHPLRFGPRWGRLHRYATVPAIGLTDPRVRLVDLDGDGVTDAVQSTDRLLCWRQDPELGWTGPRPARFPAVDPPPPLDVADPRVRWADMTGDGLTDLVLVHDGAIDYWPAVGDGRWGGRIRMADSPRLPRDQDPARILLGDVDGDGLADLVRVDPTGVTVWINRSGSGWSEPFTVRGVPVDGWDARLADLLGTGTSGVLLSRRPSAVGRAAMFFLDLTGGVRPRLLREVDNRIGAVTRIRYASSSTFAARDHRDPATRWRTVLPFPVAVVAGVETVDQVAGSRLTTEYRYRHGYWDGAEREFRGFGRVDRFDTETGDVGAAVDDALRAVEPAHLSPPTCTRSWFHLGPVEADTDDGWAELDLTAEHWVGDPALLGHIDGVSAFLAGLPDRQSRRDALRALRGRLLRTELFALDGSERPYTVTEAAYALREEPVVGDRRVFFPFEDAARTTQWERGEDPMTGFTFTGDHDEVGQPRRATTVAPPRRSARRTAVTGAVVGSVQPDRTTVLAAHRRTSYAASPTSPVRDRVAQVRTYELLGPPQATESDPDDVAQVLRDQVRDARAVLAAFDVLEPDATRLIGHLVHHYDGPAYEGLPAEQVGSHGLLTRSESLVLTDDVLDAAYAALRPDYLGGSAPPPAGAPVGFGSALGYRRESGDDVHVAGWYADTARTGYDVQLSTTIEPLPPRGLAVGMQDSLGRETRVTPDEFWTVPVTVRDSAGLVISADHDYRAGRPRRVVDPHGDATCLRYHALGLLAATWREGRDGEGGTEDAPEIRHSYALDSFRATGRPVHVHTVRRVHHAHDGVSDDVVASREYSDGLGRLVQTRAQADELAFPDGAGLLEPGVVGGPAVGERDADRVVVSGWVVYDNKGRVVGEYEPFFASGWEFRADERGRRTSTFHDPRGRAVRVVNPDGSQRRTVFGLPADPAAPDAVAPSPWVTTSYDENDLAPVSATPDGTTLTGRAPENHHFTPTTTVNDALGRVVCTIARGGPDPKSWHVTQTVHDVRGNVLTAFDELGRAAFTHAYDLLDRPLGVDSIDGGHAVTVLDATGTPVQSRDARGAVDLRTYDVLGRPAEVYARDRAGDPVTLRERIEYGDGGDPAQPDADRQAARAARRLGRPWRHRDEAGLVTVESYDLAGAPTEQERRVVSDDALAADWSPDWAAPGADDALEVTAHRQSARYDALGRVTALTVPADATGHRAVITPGYDRSGALRSVTVDGVPYVELIARDPRGRRVLAVLGNGLMTRYAFDPNTFRLTRLRTERATRAGDTWTGSGAPVQELGYGYDLAGNITAVEDRTPGCGVAGTADGRDRLVRTFGYDPLNRLVEATGRACTSITHPSPADDVARCGAFGAPFAAAATQANAPDLTETYRERYTYDPAGNLLDLHHVAGGAGWHRRFYMAGLSPADWADATTNRLTSVETGAVTSTFTHDEAGNVLTENGARRFTWDHAGRLVEFRVQAGVAPSIRARYLYGADGTRVKKWVRRGDTGALDESTAYLGDLVERHRWATAGGGENAHVHVMDGTARVALVRTGPAHPSDAGPAIRYELGDHLGSAAVTVDDTGAWINREEYFPYGETSFGSFARKRYRFTGKERDEESGLAHHGARYYAPWVARWMSCDVLQLDGLNRYAYVGGRPLGAVDLDGAASTEVDRARGDVEDSARRGDARSRSRSDRRDLDRHLRSMPQPQQRPTPTRGASTSGRGPSGTALPGRIPVLDPELPSDYVDAGGFPLGGSPGPTLPSMGSRTARRVGAAIDVLGEIHRWTVEIPQRFREFDTKWRQFWYLEWYEQTIRLVPGRTSGALAGVEGVGPSLEASRPGRASPYRGRFLYLDQAVTASSTVDELSRLRNFLNQEQHAWRTNDPTRGAEGHSILTYDRWSPISDDDFRGFLWHIDTKIHMLQSGASGRPSALGDFPQPTGNRNTG